MKRWVWVLAVPAMVGFALYGRNAAKPKGTPSGQIRAALGDALEAFNDGNLAGAMSVVSHDYKDSTGNNRDRLYLLGRRALNGEERGSVILQRLSPAIEGDTATVPVTVRVDWPLMMPRDADLVLTMKREPARVWLLFPSTRWKVTGADGMLEAWGPEVLF
jgi:hypothetical protein